MKKCALKFVLAISLAFGANCGVCIVLGIGQAQATLINATGIDEPNNDSEAYFFGLTDEVMTMIDKDEFVNPPVGTVDIESYLRVTITIAEDPGQADISWDLTDSGWQARYVAVKNGDSAHTGVKWVRYEVAGDQRIMGSGTVSTALDGNGAISHISLYATSIPDPAAVFLLGSACLIGFAATRRKFIK